MNLPLIQLDHLTWVPPDGKKVLDKQTLDIHAGSFVLLTGPSGGGKSSLLRLLVRLEEPSSGVIRFKGRPLEEYSPPVLRSEMVLLAQQPVLLQGTVRDNMLLPFRFAANKERRPPEEKELALLIERMLLGDVSLESSVGALSTGQQQRLCLIRTLLLRPRVLLLDEPVSALDPDSKEVVESMAEEFSLEGGTVIMVSHAGFSSETVTVKRLELKAGKLIPVDNTGKGGNDG